MGLQHLWSYPVHWGRDEIINYPVAVIKPPSLGMSRQACSRRGSLNNSFTQEQTQAFSMKPSHKTASQWAKARNIPGGRSWHIQTPLLPWPSRFPKARSLSLPSPAVRTMSRNRICVFHHSYTLNDSLLSVWPRSKCWDITRGLDWAHSEEGDTVEQEAHQCHFQDGTPKQGACIRLRKGPVGILSQDSQRIFIYFFFLAVLGKLVFWHLKMGSKW